jgi:hypothetical protein
LARWVRSEHRARFLVLRALMDLLDLLDLRVSLDLLDLLAPIGEQP